LIKHREQLLRTPVDFIYFSADIPSPKKNLISLSADTGESLPWTALRVPSVPNKALREFGASACAFYVLVGPIRLLHP